MEKHATARLLGDTLIYITAGVTLFAFGSNLLGAPSASTLAVTSLFAGGVIIWLWFVRPEHILTVVDQLVDGVWFTFSTSVWITIGLSLTIGPIFVALQHVTTPHALWVCILGASILTGTIFETLFPSR